MASNILTKKDFFNTTLRAFFLQNGFNYSNYQGTGYANVIYPALKKIYKDNPEKLKEVLLDNVEMYNTNPHFVPFVTNIQLVMLENDVATEDVRNMKMALMGPLAGIGDSLSQFLLAPLFSTICATLAMNGQISGPVLFLLGLNGILLTIKILTGMYGHKLGTSIIEKLSAQMSKLTNAASIVGVMVISGLVTNHVKIGVPFKYVQKIGDKEQVVQLQKMIDGIAPALLPVLYTGLMYYLLKKKKWNTYQLVILTIVIAFITFNLKIFA